MPSLPRAPPSPGGRSTASSSSSGSSSSSDAQRAGSGARGGAARRRPGGGGIRKPVGAPPRRFATRLVVRPLSELDRAWLNRLKQLRIQGFFDPQPLPLGKGPSRPARDPSPVLVQTTLLDARRGDHAVAQGYEREDVERLED